MTGSDMPLESERSSLPLSFDDIEAALCGTATPEQRARYTAAMNDKDSELSCLLNHIQTSPSNFLKQSLSYPSRKPRRRREQRPTTSKAMTTDSRPENPVNETGIVSRLHTATLPQIPNEVAFGEASNQQNQVDLSHRRFRLWPVAVGLAATILVGIGMWWRVIGSNSVVLADIRDGQNVVRLLADGRIEGLPRLTKTLGSDVLAVLQSKRFQVVGGLPKINVKADIVPRSISKLLRPYHTNVRDNQPTFEWQSYPGAESYVVTIFDADLRTVQESPMLSKTAWMPDAPLPRGTTYAWQVTAHVGDQRFVAPADSEPRPAFRVLSQDELERLLASERDAQPSHLARSVLYGSSGLLDEAEQELSELQQTNRNSSIVADLLINLRELRE